MKRITLIGEFNTLYLANIIFESHLKIPKLITWKITVCQMKGPGISWDYGSELSASYL